MPMGGEVERLYAARAAALGPGAQQLLLLAATADTDDLGLVLAAGAVIGVPAEHLRRPRNRADHRRPRRPPVQAPAGALGHLPASRLPGPAAGHQAMAGLLDVRGRRRPSRLAPGPRRHRSRRRARRPARGSADRALARGGAASAVDRWQWAAEFSRPMRAVPAPVARRRLAPGRPAGAGAAAAGLGPAAGLDAARHGRDHALEGSHRAAARRPGGRVRPPHQERADSWLPRPDGGSGRPGPGRRGGDVPRRPPADLRGQRPRRRLRDAGDAVDRRWSTCWSGSGSSSRATGPTDRGSWPGSSTVGGQCRLRRRSCARDGPPCISGGSPTRATSTPRAVGQARDSGTRVS